MSKAIADLNNLDGVGFNTGNDGIIVVQVLSALVGGTTLDVAGFTPDVIPEGHPVIQEDATGIHKPMPVGAGTAFAALPAGHTYVGHVISTTLKRKPFVGVMTRGVLNHAASSANYDMAPILTALKTANPLIQYVRDNQ